MPSGGYRNGSNVNNVGLNGNFWSVSQNSSNNAWNLYFNNGNSNMNNNNRNNGQSVRLSQDYNQDNMENNKNIEFADSLLYDVFVAYFCARKHKRNKTSQLEFEIDLENNIINLYHELLSKSYRPYPARCFVIKDSVKREVFASFFRDRVVHHLYYNYVNRFFDSIFIKDSYSCREGKGTLYGVERLEHHLRSCSENYSVKAYVLQLDIQGYFMSINRDHLYDIVMCYLKKFQAQPNSYSEEKWNFIFWLTDIIIHKDPLENCIMVGSPDNWRDLPSTKCLSCQPKGVGLPIGDLTSQLFSNIYLNSLDYFVTRQLAFRHYGRYVDDFYIVSRDKVALKNAIQLINEHLKSLGLRLHPKKIRIKRVDEAICFLGYKIYPFYRHVKSRTWRKFYSKIIEYEQIINCRELTQVEHDYFQSMYQSYCGYVEKSRSYNVMQFVAMLCPKQC